MDQKRPISRRQFLAHATAIGAALAFGRGCEHVPGVARTERRDLFPQGVASGDPAPTASSCGRAAHRMQVLRPIASPSRSRAIRRSPTSLHAAM